MSGRVPGSNLPTPAELWDEGYQAGHEDARAVQATYPQPTPNPYRVADTHDYADEHRHDWRCDLNGLTCSCGVHQGATPVDPERLGRNRL